MEATQKSEKFLSNPLKLSIYKINKEGKIFYVNNTLTKKTCCNKNELIGENHNLLKHSEMPTVIQDMINASLLKNSTYFSVNKNCTKNDREFWTLNYYKPIHNNGYEVKMIKLPKKIKNVFIKLFNKLNKIEKNAGIKFAEKFINGFFEYKNLTNFQEFIFSIYGIEYKKTTNKKNTNNKLNFNLLQNLKY